MNVALLLLPLSLAASAAAAPARPPSLLVMGWDGSDQRHVRRLLDAGRLPHLAKLVAAGSYVEIDITTGGTETKPGWAEIFTGRAADDMGIENNKVYRPIPPGATAFELWKSSYPGACAFMVAGKDANIGDRGPHEICINCQSREPRRGNIQTFWWNREKNFGLTQAGLRERWVRREGETFHHAAKVLDRYDNRLGWADSVGPAALEAIDACGDRPFFGFAHFQDPDETGHTSFDVDSYEKALIATDAWLGRLVERVARAGDVTVVVATDHGFDVGQRVHVASPHAFAASNRQGWRVKGDRKDVGATLLRALGLRAEGVLGIPLQDPQPKVKGPRGR